MSRYRRTLLTLIIVSALVLLSITLSASAKHGGALAISGSHSAAINAVPPDNTSLFAWYPAEGNANDASGNGHDANINGNVTFASGEIGQAFSFDGSTDADVELPNTTVMNSTLPLTVSAWVNPTLRTDSTGITGFGVYYPNNVISNDNPGHSGYGFGVNVFNGGSELTVEYQDAPNASFRHVPNLNFIAGQWYHVVVVYTSGEYKAYVNDQLVDDFTYTQDTSPDGSNLIRIGKHNDDSSIWGTKRFFKGQIDEVKIFQSALSDDQVSSLYGQMSLTPSSLNSGVSPTNLNVSAVGLSYNQVISAHGGFTPYSFTVSDGALPNGLTLNSSTGLISGTPTTAATYSFTVTAHDSSSLSASQSYTITIYPQNTLPPLTAPGHVWGWGNDDYTQLGDGSFNFFGATFNTPIMAQNASDVVAISNGFKFTMALKSDRTALAWGNNDYGQFGDGTTNKSLTPKIVNNLSGVIAISAGSFHTLALKSDGTVLAAGGNGNGQLGDGTKSDRTMPVTVMADPVNHVPLTGIVAISAGENYSLALKADGTVYAWGSTTGGRLGTGATGADVPTPQLVLDAYQTQLQGHDQPLTGVKQISAGDHSLAVKFDGTVYAWGNNNNGEIGYPLSEPCGAHPFYCSFSYFAATQIPNLSNIKSVSAGHGFSLALSNDGTVLAWGANNDGELGNGSTSNVGNPTPSLVSGLSNVTAIAAGNAHGMALQQDGIVKTWGLNHDGQLGNGTYNTPSTLPVTVGVLSGVAAISTSSSSFSSLAIVPIRSQTISFDPLPNKLISDPNFNVSATASSGLPVSFSADGQCAITGTTVSLTGQPGSCTITATQDGNVFYGAAPPVSRSFTIFNPQTLTGTINGVVTGGGQPLNRVAFVSICTDTACYNTTTDTSGNYSRSGLAPGTYNVQVNPPGGTNFEPGVGGPATITGGDTQTVNVDLPLPPTPPPGPVEPQVGTSADGSPVVYWQNTNTFTAYGDPGGQATIQITIANPPAVFVPDPSSQLDPIKTGKMTEIVPGKYQITLPRFYPYHGVAHVIYTIVYATFTVQTLYDIYIDPSGLVQDTNGNPVAGATVTLFRSDTSDGAFTQMPDGSGIMSPANRTNPDHTNANGNFGWDVLAGYYKVRAEKAGCTDPNDTTKSYVETGVLTIPPPVTDLLLTLKCPASTSVSSVSGSGTYNGTAQLTATLVSGGNPLNGRTISFTLNNISVGTATTGINGVATLTGVSLSGINAGSYQNAVVANFAGDNNNSYASSSGNGTLTVSPANQTININTHAPSSAVYGSHFTVAAVSDSGLAVAYSSSGSCTNNGAIFTMTSGIGICTVKYDQAGSGNYNPATQVTEYVTAQKANQTIMFGGLTGKTYGDAPFMVNATGGGSSNPVTFSAGPQNVCAAGGTNNATITILSAGNCTVTANQSGNNNYNAAASVPQMFSISQATASLTYTGDTLVSTNSSNTTSTTLVKLSALIQDANGNATALTHAINASSAASNPLQVRFSIYKSSNTTMTTADYAATGAISSANNTAVASITLPSDNYVVKLELLPNTNSYYTAPVEDAAFTVMLSGTGVAHGGGWLMDPNTINNPAGYRSDFHFTAKSTKSGVDGHSTFIYRTKVDLSAYGGPAGLRDYNFIIKSTSLSTFTEMVTTFKTATFSGNCTIKAVDRTNGKVYSTSSYQFQVDVTDKGEPGSDVANPDAYAIRVYSTTGNVLVVGTYNGSKNTSQVAIRGGNIQVK